MLFNFFAEENRLAQLSKLGDSLEKLKVIDFESFRPILNKTFEKERKSKAGRPSFDYVMMFKVLILQRLFNLSDDQTEFQITDRMSFQRFLGLSMSDKVPDAKTIWLFRDTLVKDGTINLLFNEFGRQLEERRIITHTGMIIDATFVDAPRQRNTREDNATIKEGKMPEEWKNKPHKIAQKDLDARWFTKWGEKHYGYKNHIKVDAENKIIIDYGTTSASVHDSNVFTDFLNESDQVVYADSAYVGKEIPENVKSEVCEKASRYVKLTEEQIAENRRKSKVRCRIEHVFGFMTKSMNGLTIRSIGIKRAAFWNGLTNLVYNFFRYAFLKQSTAVKG